MSIVLTFSSALLLGCPHWKGVLWAANAAKLGYQWKVGNGDLANVELYTFPVAGFALGRCQGHAEQCGGGALGLERLARCRLRELVLLEGPLKKKARAGAICNQEDED